jgi:hypothetical protein
LETILTTFFEDMTSNALTLSFSLLIVGLVIGFALGKRHQR